MPDSSTSFGARPAGLSCRVCGNRHISFLCRTYNEHSRTTWLEHARCRGCGSVFVATPVAIDELLEAYASLDERAYYEETGEASTSKFRNAAMEVSQIAPSSADLIDIGAGRGAFARALYEQGLSNISIHEIPGDNIPDLSGVVRRIYRDFDYESVPTASFDVVTMMDVMEHVPDPDHTLRAAKRALRPGGLLYFHTPVVTRLDRLMHIVQKLPILDAVGRAWQRARTSIFHLQNYTPRSLRLLMDRNAFDVIHLSCKNELSWPMARYLQVYLVDKYGFPAFMVPSVALLVAPLLKSTLNVNKGIVLARSRPTSH